MTDKTGTTARLIYKIADRQTWEEAMQTGSYAGSSDDLRDGFIHFSTHEQLRETARKHFAGRTDLLLVAVPAPSLGSALKWEPSRGGALFPHLYAKLPTTAALWVRELPQGRDGIPDIDAALAERPEAGG